MKIQVIASGSKGNCTAVTAETAILLFDVGVSLSKVQCALEFKKPKACFITHEHSDHSNKKTIVELMRSGTEIYMTKGTAKALEIDETHRLHFVEVGEKYKFNDEISFYVTANTHDAAEPVSYHARLGNERLSYIIDTGKPPQIDVATGYLLIEANHSAAELKKAEADGNQRQRILENHLSIEKVAKYLEGRRGLKEVHLLHISKRHGDGVQFQERIQNVVGAGVKVFSH